MTRHLTILAFSALPLLSQTNVTPVADEMLSRIQHAQWKSAYPANPAACQDWTPYQLAIYATDQWSYHCSQQSAGLIQESFYYVFNDPPRPERLRVDIRPENESPEFTAALEHALEEKLTRKFGPPSPEPEMMEIGFRHLRYGQPVEGRHWRAGNLQYFLHHNQTNPAPMGMRRGVQLIVLEQTLFEARMQDDFIHQVDGLGSATGGDDPIRARLNRASGADYVRIMNATWSNTDRSAVAQTLYRQILDLLNRANHAPRETRAMLLLASDPAVVKLGGMLIEIGPSGERESGETSSIRRRLASFDVKLGAMTHYGGLLYNNDLLWRVWREFSDTEAGELAFLQMQRRGWNTDTREGCPPNPDLFHAVIEKGEAFLASHPQTKLRTQIVYTIAVANESWWSIARSPANDGIVSAPPYPRKELNKKDAPLARERAIRYYREILQLAPNSPEAASAARRLPRLLLNLDTGQRSFFCFYC